MHLTTNCSSSHRCFQSESLPSVVSSDRRNAAVIKETVLASSRPVKKGPGRRPQSAKRQRFMDLCARGWSVPAAAREVDVSRSAANNWPHGYKTYRHGVVVGAVAALDRLEVREVSSRFLSQNGSRSLT